LFETAQQQPQPAETAQTPAQFLNNKSVKSKSLA
jgi:hypothetical protein